jgi:Uma2 family endonuclease
VSPTGGESGRRSLQLAYQLARWNEERGLGVAFGSSTGFKFPDGSILSPDAAFVAREAWEALSGPEREGFPPLSPEAVFEVRSASQDPEELRAKMGLYLRNGVRLGVLVDPYARAVEVFRPGEAPLRFEGVEEVSLDPELPGFVLRLSPLW